VLYSGGRDANSEKIGCENVGVTVGKYGRIQVDPNFRTTNPLVFAIGDVIGPPGLASFAQQSARVVTDMLFRWDEEDKDEQGGGKYQEKTLEDWVDDDFFAGVAAANDDAMEGEREAEMLNRLEAPLTLWTIPEVASVGMSVEQALQRGLKLADDGGNIVTGYAYFKDLARGRLSGDLEGFLKIIARVDSPSRHVIVGVHIVGDGANELVQLGSMLVLKEITLEELSNAPFAAVTLSGLYQQASDNALCSSPFNKLRNPNRKGITFAPGGKLPDRKIRGAALPR
jgi:NAD(P) transhydrogenase